MIRKTYLEKILFNSLSKISERVVLDYDLDIANFILTKHKLLQVRTAKAGRTLYFLKFFIGSNDELHIYFTVIRNNRTTCYYFINISYSQFFNDIDEFISNISIVGQSKKAVYFNRIFL